MNNPYPLCGKSKKPPLSQRERGIVVGYGDNEVATYGRNNSGGLKARPYESGAIAIAPYGQWWVSRHGDHCVLLS